MVNIAFTGGGTGGHIYPGLAVADELLKQTDFKVRLFWIGSSAGMDRALVEEAGIEFFGIPSGKLRRYFSFKNLLDVFKIAAGFFAARKILKKQKAVLLFSKGGFVSVPPCNAASSLGIPVYTHESDFSPGLATKIIARFAARKDGKIFTAYEDTAQFFRKKKIRSHVLLSGNPIRAAFKDADPARGRAFLGIEKDAKILLALGGSQGAAEINELIRAALPALTDNYTIVHQTGPNLAWDIPASEKYKTFPYIKEEMPDVMAASDLIIGRSGAGIWEWAFLGKPMILIPLRGIGTRGDQIENARYFEKAQAAQVLGENPTAQDLIGAVDSIFQDPEKYKRMKAASEKIGKKNGTEIIVNAILDYIKREAAGES